MSKTKRINELLKRTESLMKGERWGDAISLLKENSRVVEKHSELLWNCGWCYFKLERMNQAEKYLLRAMHLTPESHRCKFGLGVVYLKKKQYKEAESLLYEALQTKESYVARISLALAYLAQGKVEEAEKAHLDGLRLKPKESERYESYAAFLSDVGRASEAHRMSRRAKELQRIN